MAEDSKFNAAHNSGSYLMKANNVAVGLNMPAALKSYGVGKEEKAHGLPPYRPRKAFLVDEYPACPKEWMRSTGRIKSFFVPIVEGAGLWLDLNESFRTCPQHVAAVVSIQGVNALTGLPTKDAQLEQYKDECPKHKKPFGPDRYCKECDYKWPAQNYLSTTAQPQGEFWLDGFRAEDGFIRQYVFTKAKMRGVANAIIGDDRVFALGVSFFLSKEPKPATRSADMRGYAGMPGAMHLMEFTEDTALYDKGGGSKTTNISTSWTAGADYLCSASNSAEGGLIGASGPAGPAGPKGHPGESVKYSATLGGSTKKKSFASNVMRSAVGSKGLMSSPGVPVHEVDMSSVPIACAAAGMPSAPIAVNTVAVAAMEVAAGARVNQRIWDDPNPLDFWQKEPDALIVINYCTEEECDKIIAEGRIDLSGSKEGFMDKLPVGNP